MVVEILLATAQARQGSLGKARWPDQVRCKASHGRLGLARPSAVSCKEGAAEQEISLISPASA